MIFISNIINFIKSKLLLILSILILILVLIIIIETFIITVLQYENRQIKTSISVTNQKVNDYILEMKEKDQIIKKYSDLDAQIIIARKTGDIKKINDIYLKLNQISKEITK